MRTHPAEVMATLRRVRPVRCMAGRDGQRRTGSAPVREHGPGSGVRQWGARKRCAAKLRAARRRSRTPDTARRRHAADRCGAGSTYRQRGGGPSGCGRRAAGTLRARSPPLDIPLPDQVLNGISAAVPGTIPTCGAHSRPGPEQQLGPRTNGGPSCWCPRDSRGQPVCSRERAPHPTNPPSQWAGSTLRPAATAPPSFAHTPTSDQRWSHPAGSGAAVKRSGLAGDGLVAVTRVRFTGRLRVPGQPHGRVVGQQFAGRPPGPVGEARRLGVRAM